MSNKIATVYDLIKYLDNLEPTNKISDRIDAMAFKYKKYLEGYDLNIYPVDIGGIINEDRIAFYLLQYKCLDQLDHSLLHLETMASCGYFFDHILKCWSDLLAVEGIDARLRGLLNKRVDPDSVLWELLVAISYLRMRYIVKFIPETSEHPTADLNVEHPLFSMMLRKDIKFDVECKFYKRKNYDSEESQRCRDILQCLIDYIKKNKLNLSFEIEFKKELDEILNNSIFEVEINRLIGGGLSVPFSLEHPDFTINIKYSNISKVNAICEEESTSPGPMLARLLSGADCINQEEYLIVGEGDQVSGMPSKYFNRLEYASVIQWSNPSSKGKRFKHVKGQLARIDKQLNGALRPVVHIRLPNERDQDTSKDKYDRNQREIFSFNFNSAIQGIVISYLSSKIGELNSYHIDETADTFWGNLSFFHLLRSLEMIPINIIDVDEFEEDFKSWEMPIPTKY